MELLPNRNGMKSAGTKTDRVDEFFGSFSSTFVCSEDTRRKTERYLVFDSLRLDFTFSKIFSNLHSCS